jgi:hypothetical protein
VAWSFGNGNGVGGGFLGVNFFGVVEWCFCWGFCEKRCVACGFLMVRLWWMRGELWCVDGRIFKAEKMPLFRDLFLVGCG